MAKEHLPSLVDKTQRTDSGQKNEAKALFNIYDDCITFSLGVRSIKRGINEFSFQCSQSMVWASGKSSYKNH